MVPENVILSENKNELILDYGKSSSSYSAELLRVKSPSAEVKGHNGKERKLVSGKRYILIDSIELVGNYAIRIKFDDGHMTGIYTWKYLQTLSNQKEIIWRDYISELNEKGLDRG